MIRVGIYGVTGYAGFELARLLMGHPMVSIEFAAARSAAGQDLQTVFPTTLELPIISPEAADPATVDLVFCCLPHGSAVPVVAQALDAGARVVDLSADFRLHNPEDYLRWYNQEHPNLPLLAEAVYGLPERHRQAIRTARLVANPGCYPTGIILALLPLIEGAWLTDSTVIVDSKSGVSGAGRGLSLKTHFGEAAENFSSYKIGRNHRHIAEMEQETGLDIIFSPHLLPVVRGILSTIYVSLDAELSPQTIFERYAHYYATEPFVTVLPLGRLPELRHAVHTNLCVLGIQPVEASGGRHILVAVEDNLLKGAAGQAVQNMNLMFGLEETLGLK